MKEIQMKLNNERNYALLHSGLIVYPIGSTMRTCPFEGNINTKLLGIDMVSKGVFNIHLSFEDEGYTHQINQSDLSNITDYDGTPISTRIVEIEPTR